MLIVKTVIISPPSQCLILVSSSFDRQKLISNMYREGKGYRDSQNSLYVFFLIVGAQEFHDDVESIDTFIIHWLETVASDHPESVDRFRCRTNLGGKKQEMVMKIEDQVKLNQTP